MRIVLPAVIIALFLIGFINNIDPAASSERSRSSSLSTITGLRAVQLAENGEFDQAAKILEPGVAGGCIDAMILRGTIFRKAGKYDAAIADLDRAMKINPGDSDIFTQRAFAVQQQGHEGWPDEVAKYASLAIQLAPNEALPRLLLGNAFFERGELAAAIAEYTHGLQCNPNSYSALAGRAQAFAANGEFQKARQDAERAKAACTNQAQLQEVAGIDEFVKELEAMSAK